MSLISLRHRKLDAVQSTNDGKNLKAFQLATAAYLRSALMRAAVSPAMAAVWRGLSSANVAKMLAQSCG